MPNLLGVSLIALSVIATDAFGQGAVDRSFDHAYWTNESPAQAAARVHKTLREWKRLPPVKLPACVTPLSSVSGLWIGSADPAMGCIRVAKRSSGVYDIRFAADGHNGGWRMRRTATLTPGVLEFSGPLLDYELPPYARMYAVGVGSERWLVPETSLPAVEAALAKNGCQSLPPNHVIGILYEPAKQDDCSDLLGPLPSTK